MRDVKVKRDELLDKIRKNRESHIAEYKEACDGYKQKAIERIKEVTSELTTRIETLKKGEMLALASVSFSLPVPRSHEKDYDQVIAMLEMSVDSEITLRSDEFACYVMDDWDWKADFANVSNIYK